MHVRGIISDGVAFAPSEEFLDQGEKVLFSLRRISETMIVLSSMPLDTASNGLDFYDCI